MNEKRNRFDIFTLFERKNPCNSFRRKNQLNTTFGSLNNNGLFNSGNTGNFLHFIRDNFTEIIEFSILFH